MIPHPSLTARRSAFAGRVFARRQWRALWFPLLGTLLAAAMSMLPYGWNLRWLGNGFAIVFLAGLTWFLGLALWRFARKRMAGGFAALACLVAALFALVPLALVSMLLGMARSEDGFADGLTLPVGIELAEPGGSSPSFDLPGGPEDGFQSALRAALVDEGGDDAALALRLPSLERLRKQHPALLDRYLAAHPAWRVYEERGRRFATRRWMVGSVWRMSLHGYYSKFESSGQGGFQSRTTIGFSGKPWARGGQHLDPGKREQVTLRKGNSMWESLVIVPAGDLLVEQFEQSSARERRITRAAFEALEREFAAILEKPAWDAVAALLPVGARLHEEASIGLDESFQGGIYQGVVRCNPGEPGRIYLKAFEITRKHPLSADRLETATSEWVGWSADPEEMFLSETHFTIFEGDWEQYYGARFEVWFDPDDGGSERKLMERNFKIEGWMH